MAVSSKRRWLLLGVLALCGLFALSALSHARAGHWPSMLFALGALIMVWPDRSNLALLRQPIGQCVENAYGRQATLALIVFVVASVWALFVHWVSV